MGSAVSRRGVSATVATLIGVVALLLGMVAFTATTVYLVRAVQSGSAIAGGYAGESKALVKVYAVLEMEKSGDRLLNKTYLVLENLWPDELTVDHVALASRSGGLIAEKPLSIRLKPGEAVRMKPSDIDPRLALYDEDFWRFKREVAYFEMHVDVGGGGSSFKSYPEYRVRPSPPTATPEPTITPTVTPTVTATRTLTRTLTKTLTKTATTATSTATVTTTVTPTTTTTTATTTVTTTVTSTATSTVTATITSTYVTTPTTTVTTTCTKTVCSQVNLPRTYTVVRVTAPTLVTVTVTSYTERVGCSIYISKTTTFLTATTTYVRGKLAGWTTCSICGECPEANRAAPSQYTGQGSSPPYTLLYTLYLMAPIVALTLAPRRGHKGWGRLTPIVAALMVMVAPLAIPQSMEAQTVTVTVPSTSTVTVTTTTTETVTSTVTTTVTSTAPTSTRTVTSTATLTEYRCYGSTVRVTVTYRPIIVSTTTIYKSTSCTPPMRTVTVTVTIVRINSTVTITHWVDTYRIVCMTRV